jgi:hypothetical protein
VTLFSHTQPHPHKLHLANYRNVSSFPRNTTKLSTAPIPQKGAINSLEPPDTQQAGVIFFELVHPLGGSSLAQNIYPTKKSALEFCTISTLSLFTFLILQLQFAEAGFALTAWYSIYFTKK